MARTKAEYEAPKALSGFEGEGTEDVAVSFKLPEVKDGDKVVREGRKHSPTIRVPKNQAGIVAWQKAVNAAGLDANEILADALGTSIFEQAKSECLKAWKEGKDMPDVLTIVPAFASFRAEDPIEAAGNRYSSLLRVLPKGSFPNAEQMAAVQTGIGFDEMLAAYAEVTK